MNYKKSLSILMVFLSLTLCGGKSFADEIHKNLVHIVKHGDAKMHDSVKNSLTKYNLWWKTLSSRQKKITRAVDKIEKEYKNSHSQLPIEDTAENAAEISNQVGVVDLSDIHIVEERLKQYIVDYKNMIKAEELTKNVDKTKAIINGVFD